MERDARKGCGIYAKNSSMDTVATCRKNAVVSLPSTLAPLTSVLFCSGVPVRRRQCW
jgi:hypothetical protein